MLAFSENSELALRITAHCDRYHLAFANVYRPLVKIVRRRSALSEADLWNRLEATELLIERHGGRYRRSGAAVYATHRAIAGTHALRLGLFGRATRHFLAAVAAHPVRAIHWGRLSRALTAALNPDQVHPGFDYVLIARTAAAERSFTDLKADLDQALLRVHQAPGQKRRGQKNA